MGRNLPYMNGHESAFQKIFEPFVDLSPVHDVPEHLDKLAPVVLVVEIIRVLPDIQDHQNPEHRVDVCVVLFDLHDDGPVRLFAEREGSPTRALGACRRLRKQLFEPVEGAELLVDGFRDCF